MIQSFADWLTYELLEFAPATRLGESVDFFLYDTLKILLLLFLISCFMGVVNAWFPVARVRRFLTEKKLYGTQYFFASLFGAVTPFCSCSSIPLFIGFVRGGIPLGVTLAFLITSPLVNEVAVALFLAVFGWKITCLYVGSGLLLGMVGGALLGRMGLERYLTPWALAQTAGLAKGNGSALRLRAVVGDALGIVRGVLPYVLAGIAIGAAVHGYVPEDYFAGLLGGGWWSVPAAVLCAVPLYANAAGIVPVIEVLVAKGVPLGTAIAFMMAVVGLSLPEAMLLKKVMQWRLLAVFFGTVTLLIILSGYLFLLLM